MSNNELNSGKSYLERKIMIPKYTLGEELVNSISHGVGAVLGIAGLCMCVVRSTMQHSIYGIVSSYIFGMSLVILYTMSCLYHSFKPNNAKRVMRIFDHCTIFLLIAGTYTPFCLVTFLNYSKALGWWMFGILWFVAALGILLNSIDIKKYRVFSMLCYLIMGWCIIFKAHLLPELLTIPGLVLLVAGGVAYTIGAILYGVGTKIKYMHSIFHIFICIGSLLQFLCILLYVV